MLRGRAAQSVERLIHSHRSRVRYPVRPHTFVPPSADSRRIVFSYCRKQMHEVQINRLGGLSLPNKSVDKLMTVPT